MPIRLSGLASGLDTEALVEELVSAYATKKENYTKDQTKLEWKKEAWEELNTEVNSFFKSSLSSMRMSGSYTKQKVEVSDSTKASVTASGSAALGVQTLQINEIAKAGYLTGAKINASSATSKLSELGFSGSGKVAIAVGKGEKVEIEVNADTTISDFVNKLKEQTGITASYDETNKRIFISSEETGVDKDFHLTAEDADGNLALYALGLSSADTVDTESLSAWYTKVGASTTTDASGKTILDESATKAAIQTNIANELYEKIQEYKTYESTKSTNNDIVTVYEAYIAEKKAAEDAGEEYTGEVPSITEEQYNTAKAWLAAEENQTNPAAEALNTTYADYMALDGIDLTSDLSKDDIVNAIYAKTVENYTLQNSLKFNTGDNAAVRIAGSDAEIILNGAKYESSSNTFVVNGLTVVAKGKTNGAELSITTSTDADGIYDSIKNMLSTYNTLVNKFSKLYNAESARDYKPLTDDEKDEMSDEEVEKWEKKIKDALLKGDSSLSSLMTLFSTAMGKSYYILDGMAATWSETKKGYVYNGEVVASNESGLKSWAASVGAKSYSASDFGVGTLSYFTAAENEKYALHIDGNSEDGDVSDKTDKLKTAISADPKTVAAFFSALTGGLYNDLNTRMTSTEMNSKYKVYNDKKLDKDISEVKSSISDWEERLQDLEDSWYKKFSAMEKALSELQNQSNSLGNLMGTS